MVGSGPVQPCLKILCSHGRVYRAQAALHTHLVQPHAILSAEGACLSVSPRLYETQTLGGMANLTASASQLGR